MERLVRSQTVSFFPQLFNHICSPRHNHPLGPAPSSEKTKKEAKHILRYTDSFKKRQTHQATSLPPPTAKQKNSRTQKHISTQSGTMQKPPLATQSFLHWQPMPTTTSPRYDNTKQREKQEPLSCKIWLHHVLLRSLPSTPPPLRHSSLVSRTKHPSFANPPLRSPIVLDRKIIIHKEMSFQMSSQQKG